MLGSEWSLGHLLRVIASQGTCLSVGSDRVLIGMKWADLESRFMITQIELKLRAVIGKPTMKSMLISSHFHSIVLSYCISPLGFM
jgi:hypothetical protein